MSFKKVKRIWLGRVPLGGGAPIVVQSMTNTDTRDVGATLDQIGQLAARGCEAVRVAVPDMIAARALPRILAECPMPLIADIHFDHTLAIASLKAGVAGIRINPGNIGSKRKILEVAAAARDQGAVIRVGVNSGSLERDLLAKHGGATSDALAESAVRHARLLEDAGFENLKISIKSSSVRDTIDACVKLRAISEYPLHLGITEAGSLLKGSIKSAVGLGILLHMGIGDTIRVSLTADPVEEVTAAWEILRALGLRRRGPEIVSCPTCGRTEIDLFGLAREVERELADSDADIKVAVMGCVVNGPGEARDADIGIAGGRDKGIIFRKGKIVGTARGRAELMAAFMEELRALLADKASLADKTGE